MKRMFTVRKTMDDLAYALNDESDTLMVKKFYRE